MGGTKIDKTIDMADKTFPSSTLFHYPILLTLADGNMHTTNELIAIEIENKSKTTDAVSVVTDWVNKIGLDIENAYHLSWDDKYCELCKEQNKTIESIVTFDKDMPKIDVDFN